ncbi:MAG TPA: amino acid adenylation domain-containing protein [Streptosporangiaceae bacterium]
MLTDNQRAALAARLRQGRATASETIPPRPPDQQHIPLSFAQEQLWFLDQLAPGRPTYNIPQALRLSGPLDPSALSAAFSALTARHESLRTRLTASDPGKPGDPTQLIDPPAPLTLELTDLSGNQDRTARLRELARAESIRPFNLSGGGSLLRVRLFRVAADDHVLLVVIHHVIFDGWSAQVLLRDLAALYRQQITGDPSGLGDLPIQFPDYALWERTDAAARTSPSTSPEPNPALTELEQYWRDTLTHAPTVDFPAERPRPIIDDDNGALAEYLIDTQLLSRLRALSQRTGSTLFVVLLSAIQALLHRYTNQTDLVVGTVTANRRRPELTSLIGFLVNTLPIRTDISGDPPFTELIERVRQATIGAYAHQDLPFAQIVAASRTPRDPSRTPLFQIAMTYAERDQAPIPAAGVNFRLSDLIVGITAAKFDLDFTIESRASGLWIECSYKTSLFDESRITRLLEHLSTLLGGAASDPAKRLSELPLLTPDELARELTIWNQAATPTPPGCVHEAFERQAASTPNAIAVEFGAERVSYANLNRHADQIAEQLPSADVRPDVPVGVALSPGPRRLAALIGIWKAGAPYLPLDPALPPDRLTFMITDANASVIVTDEASSASLPPTSAQVVNLDAGPPADRASSRPHPTTAAPANLAYVIYTSGSTGPPKGVAVEHRQAISYLASAIDRFQVGPTDSVLQFSSLSFDASVQEMFMPLLAGGRVVLATPDTLHSPHRLIALMTERAITIAVLTPSVIALLGDHELPDLRLLLSGGEQLPSDLAIRWRRQNLRFFNDYGPTETTVSAVCHELTASTPQPPPIGLPLPHCRAYVLDQNLNPVPAGVIAELHIGGTGVARGYLNRPGLTAQRFIPDPFRRGGGRLYRTGDRCYRRSDGTIVYAGRADQQVKLRGLRIELGEIESAIAANAQVRQSVVTVFNDHGGESLLVAYICPEDGVDLDLAELRRQLSATLPGYMLPARLITLAKFPLTVSGKVDRQALPAPAFRPTPGRGEPPATEAEAVLTELFASVLNRPLVGPADNFFASGGNSLQVMRLVDLIAKRTGHDLTPATVLLNPTPRDLASHLNANPSSPVSPTSAASPTNAASLVPLTADLGRPSLILIHAIGGTIFDYANLAADLTGTFTVYGLQAAGLARSRPVPPTTIDDLVTQYTDLLRAGPGDKSYSLGGWSMGAVLAYEVARRLEAEAARVPLVVLLDPPYSVPRSAGLRAQFTAQFVADAAASLGYSAGDLPDPQTSSTADQLSWLANLADASDTQSNTQLARRLDIFAAHSRLLSGYQPEAASAIRASVVLVSANHSLNAPASPDWLRHFDGPVHRVVLDSDHYEFLRPPLSIELAASICEWHQTEQGERSPSDAVAKPGPADR